ncbi:MAG: hypothetical protein IJ091_03115 [Oscillospiraceae bacterium]|nr:hypothetical protein [Oscillospiraceae bacterium]
MFDPVTACKKELYRLLERTLRDLGLNKMAEYSIEYSALSPYGDFSSNIALVLSKHHSTTAVDLANKICSALDLKDTQVRSASVSEKGFLNIFMDDDWYLKAAETVLLDKTFGTAPSSQEKMTVILPASLDECSQHPKLFRSLATAIAIKNICSAAGYATRLTDICSIDTSAFGRSVFCVPSSIWHRSNKDFVLPVSADRVLVNGLDDLPLSTDWDPIFVLTMNKVPPEASLPSPFICTEDVWDIKDLRFQYSWITSLVRQFKQNEVVLQESLTEMRSFEPKEIAYLRLVLSFPNEILSSSVHNDPSSVYRYLSKLSSIFSEFRDYLGRKEGLQAAKDGKLHFFCSLTEVVLRNGLALFGVPAKDSL